MENWTQEFETLYWQTYQALYHHARLVFAEEEKARELLILTFQEAYQREEQLQKEKSPQDWLMKRMDILAESKLEATKEMLEDSYSEEKMQSKEAKKESRPELDETSLLLEIEERLEIVDEPEIPQEKGLGKSILQGIFSVVLVAVAVAVIFFCITHIRL